ncbi:hypothetical protein HPG69_001917 [Diceros bicornis minor]|uniref:Uncharacterized protein n=1 Tax=Diceros bicornis minor TaxID=77932 RepID=A0A7J7FBX7_DICBM|nr:hypothetical protein HPG69_001917 [Diceros bicornis minor]
MQWVFEDKRRAPFRLATVVLDALVQEDAKSSGPSVVQTHHGPSEEEAQDACGGVDGRKGGGGTVVSSERRGAEVERAERHSGDGGEGEDREELEGAGDQETQASIERDRHGEQRVGDDPEAERHPAGGGTSCAGSRILSARLGSHSRAASMSLPQNKSSGMGWRRRRGTPKGIAGSQRLLGLYGFRRSVRTS